MTISTSKLFVLFVCSFGILATSNFLAAQDRKFDAKKYIERLDRNGNQVLEPEEMSGKTSDWLRKMGLDPSKPIRVRTVFSKMERENAKREKQKRRDNMVLKVPGFGAVTEKTEVNSFSTDTASAQANKQEYSDEILNRVSETLRRYDANGNGRLDADELKKARWGSPTPQESDLNRDGRLSRTELANRYLTRERERNRNSNRERSSSSRRERSTKSESKKQTTSLSRPGLNRSSRTSRASSSRSPRTTSKASTSKSGAYNSGSDRYAKYADGVMTKYDTNKDGKIDRKELKSYRRPPENADGNKDGSITKDELIAAWGGKSQAKSTPSKSKSDSSRDSRRDRSSSSSGSKPSSSFDGSDANGDGQIQMHEYSSDWDADVLAKFQERDLNGDGVITAREWNDSK